MIKFEIKPYDVLLFRDGRPLDFGDRAYSIFPPYPSTFQGAIRAKLWANQKVAGFENSWLEPQNPSLEFYGPFLKKKGDILFPLPFNILKERKKEEIKAFSIPLKESNFIKKENTNIEVEKLPWSYGTYDVELASGFISLEAIKKWLLEEEYLPQKEEVFDFKEVFSFEERIGINMESRKNVVKKEDGVFAMRLIRLKEDVTFLFWVKAKNNENTLKQIFKMPPQVIILGGDRKTASYKIEEDKFFEIFDGVKEKIKNRIKGKETFKVLFLTPAIFENWKPEGSVFDKLEPISCVLGRPLDVGGWDLKNKCPKSMRKAIPAGSVFWFKLKKGADFEEIFDKLWLKFNTQYDDKLGFGLTIVGV